MLLPHEEPWHPAAGGVGSPAPWRVLAGVPAGDAAKRRPARGEAADKEHRVTRRSLQGSEGNQTALPTPPFQR